MGPLPHLNSALRSANKIRYRERVSLDDSTIQSPSNAYSPVPFTRESRIKYLTLLGTHPQISFVDNLVFTFVTGSRALHYGNGNSVALPLILGESRK